MRQGYTHICVVLDASGSMHSMTDEVRRITSSGPENSTYGMTVRPDSTGRWIYRSGDLDRYEPGGCTALYDAVCTGIDELGAFFAAMAEDERPESVLFVIVTDGYENASRRFSNADVQRRVRLQAETYSWKFVFLAKGIDSEEAARDIGIDKNMAVFEDAVSDFSDGESVLYEMNERMANVRQSRRKK